MKYLSFLLITVLSFYACQISVNSGNKETGSTGKKIRNDIELHPSGLTVEQAFLTFDDGPLVPEDNKIEVGQKVKMKLLVKGWEVLGDKVKPGATEKVITSEGDFLLDSEDLFAAYSEGVSEKDAGVISLSASITDISKLYDYFLVEFRVWDKQKPGNDITGSYKLYLK